MAETVVGQGRFWTEAGQPVGIGPGSIGDEGAPLNWWNVLVLVNAQSPASREVAKLYRQFHPGMDDLQFLLLQGLQDSAAPGADAGDEILTREEYETLIAEPTRTHLVSCGLVDQIHVIVTTAGMPYRIEDTDSDFADAVKPAGSDALLVVGNRTLIDAASVESDLAVLFLTDPALNDTARLPLRNRVVNPYQGYKTSIKRWACWRDILGEREQMRWTIAWRIPQSPLIEGEFNSGGYTSQDRIMSPASIYLTARLDGPRVTGRPPVFSVYRMLKRAAAVSDPSAACFVGYNPTESVIAIDHAPGGGNLQSTTTYNLPWTRKWLDGSTNPVPPDAAEFEPPWLYGDHYLNTYEWLTGGPISGLEMSVGGAQGLGGVVIYDETAAIMNQDCIATEAGGVVAVLTFGRNGNDGRPVSYLTTSGPSGGPLFTCVPGAFFTSLESYNAVTMLTDVWTSQGKIADFIRIGGTCAVGHALEPESFASPQADYILRNMLRDADSDGIADLTIVEAVFSGLPYLSWTEVFIGDPLMRFHLGEGATVDLTPTPGDIDGDRIVGFYDAMAVLAAYDTQMGDPMYSVPADVTEDGVVDGDDLTFVLNVYGTAY